VHGFVADTREADPDRVVIFGSGTVLRERILGIDEANRRIAWSIVDGAVHASQRVRPAAVGSARALSARANGTAGEPNPLV
jgi:hypothetical protein